MATCDGILDASGKVDMVVLKQDHVEQTDAMVHATADLDSLLLQHAHAGSGLAGVKDMCLCALQTLHITVCHRGDAAHALHDVKHQSLGLKQRTHLSCNDHGNVALLDRRSVAHQHLYLHCGVEACKHALCHLYACKDAVFLDEKMRLAHCFFRNATQCCVITIAYVFGKSQIDKTVFKFVYAIHIYYKILLFCHFFHKRTTGRTPGKVRTRHALQTLRQQVCRRQAAGC